VCHRRTQIVDRKGGQHMSDEHVDDFRELEDFWPDMAGLADGVDIFLAQYGPPSGLDADAAYLTASPRRIAIRYTCGVVPGHEHETVAEAQACIDGHYAYLVAQAGSISSLCNDYEPAMAMALGDGSGAEG